MSAHIAIVEDEPALADNYAEALRRKGFRVSQYRDRAGASAAFGLELPDLAIIDIGLGDEPDGGFELCRELRMHSAELPVVFLTARDDDIDIVSGFRLGADDYLSKDISLLHLQTRVVALLGRVAALRRQPPAASECLQRGDLRVDKERMEVSWRRQVVPLTVTEYWIVEALVRHPGHVKSRQQLMDAANTVLDDSTVTSHIKRIRRKFQAQDSDFNAIETAYGLGYRWRER